jgi:hypothetical protein
LLAIEGRTAEKVAKMVVVAKLAAMWLYLAENSRTVAARSLGEVNLAFSCWILAMFFLVSGHPSVLWHLPWYWQ